MCFGLNGTPYSTLAVVASALGISRERVRTIENVALKQLSTLCADWSRQEVGVGVMRCPPCIDNPSP